MRLFGKEPTLTDTKYSQENKNLRPTSHHVTDILESYYKQRRHYGMGARFASFSYSQIEFEQKSVGGPRHQVKRCSDALFTDFFWNYY